MTPSEALAGIEEGKLQPVYLVVGDEAVLAERVVHAARRAALAGGVADFNLEILDASEASPGDVLSIAKTVPMMSPKRFVLVRGIERWDKKQGTAQRKGSRSAGTSKAGAGGKTDALSDYIKDPTPTTCLVMTASKLDRRRKIYTAAKKREAIVLCESLSRWDLPKFVEQEANRRGHRLARGVADVIADVAGPDLAPVLDALERLSLYVGEGRPIQEPDVAACITRVRPSSVWDLVAAVASKDVATALRIVSDVYDPRDGGLPLVGALAWSTRQLLMFSLTKSSGASVREAAAAARVPPFKVKQVQAQARHLSASEMERWLRVLARADRQLKGSKMKSLAILEAVILTMTTGVSM